MDPVLELPRTDTEPPVEAVALVARGVIAVVSEKGLPTLDFMRARDDRVVEPESLTAYVSSDELSPEHTGGARRISSRAYERVVRIISLVLIAASIASADLWPATRSAIYLVLALTILFLLVVQDLIPAPLPGRRRFAIEAIGAITSISALVALTGGPASPFFFAYFLVVSGAAFWISGLAPVLLLGLVTGAAYLVAITVAPGGWLTGTPEVIPVIARVAFDLLSLALVVFLAAVAGREQRRLADAAVRLSRYDALTRLYHRAYFLELVDREMERSSRTGRTFGLLMLDLDDLKPINDSFGHPVGDRILRAVGDVLRREVRKSDSAARYGGDEFMVLLPETDAAGSLVLAEKLRGDITHIAIRLPDRSVGTSVSVGIASYPGDATTAEALVRVVDQAMYEAKRLGKNRIAYAARATAQTDAAPATTQQPLAATQQPPAANQQPPTANQQRPAVAQQSSLLRQAVSRQESVHPAAKGRAAVPLFGPGGTPGEPFPPADRVSPPRVPDGVAPATLSPPAQSGSTVFGADLPRPTVFRPWTYEPRPDLPPSPRGDAPDSHRG